MKRLYGYVLAAKRIENIRLNNRFSRAGSAVRVFRYALRPVPERYEKQHARESVFRSERMPESIDHHTEEGNETCQRKEACPRGHPGGGGNRLFAPFDSRRRVKMRSGAAFHQHSGRRGTLLAFPGSMCGAFLCGMLYKYGKHLPFAYVGELFGTSVIGGLLSWPVAVWLMGSESAVYGFILPFFVSSCGGTILAAVLVTAMKRMKVFDVYLGNLEPQAK